MLDYLVAKCKAKDRWYYNEFDKCVYIGCDDAAYSPSTNRDQGYEILEREKIDVMHIRCLDTTVRWEATADSGDTYLTGDTPLEAGLRVYVHKKLGEEVDVPDELIQFESQN